MGALEPADPAERRPDRPAGRPARLRAQLGGPVRRRQLRPPALAPRALERSLEPAPAADRYRLRPAGGRARGRREERGAAGRLRRPGRRIDLDDVDGPRALLVRPGGDRDRRVHAAGRRPRRRRPQRAAGGPVRGRRARRARHALRGRQRAVAGGARAADLPRIRSGRRRRGGRPAQRAPDGRLPGRAGIRSRTRPTARRGSPRAFLELPRLLEDARAVGTDVVYLWDYWEASPFAPEPHYFNKGDYIPRRDLGGASALLPISSGGRGRSCSRS